MKECTMKLEDLHVAERNVRIHTDQQLREFEKSVRMFGQIRPIVIDENNTILAGNGLYQTLRRMQIKEAKVYKFEDLTENQKKKLMIADNKIFSLGIENIDTLNEFLEELQGDLDIPGYDEDILRQMVADADEITARISEYGTLDQSEVQHIKEANERREHTGEGSKSIDSDPYVSDNGGGQGNSSKFENEDNQEAAETGRYVICPKCGETIWL